MAAATTRNAAKSKGGIEARASLPKIGKRAKPTCAPASARWICQGRAAARGAHAKGSGATTAHRAGRVRRAGAPAPSATSRKASPRPIGPEARRHDGARHAQSSRLSFAGSENDRARRHGLLRGTASRRAAGSRGRRCAAAPRSPGRRSSPWSSRSRRWRPSSSGRLFVAPAPKRGRPASTRRISAVSAETGSDPAAREGCLEAAPQPARHEHARRRTRRRRGSAIGAVGRGEGARARPVEADQDELVRAVASPTPSGRRRTCAGARRRPSGPTRRR